MLYLYDDIGKLVRWNKKHEEMTGYSSAEMEQMYLADWFKGNYAALAKITREVARAKRDGFADTETTLNKKDGSTIPIHFTAVPLTINGKIHFAGIGIDNTERNFAVAALHELNERLEQKVEIRTQELIAANQELIAQNEEISAQNEEMKAMNEEIVVINQSLQDANQQLEEEIEIRQQNEAELSTRECQYRAITGLLLQPEEQMETTMQTILRDALQLIHAPEGYIGLFDEKRNSFTIKYAVGSANTYIGKAQPADRGLRGQVYQTGETKWVEDYRFYTQRLPNPALGATA